MIYTYIQTYAERLRIEKEVRLRIKRKHYLPGSKLPVSNGQITFLKSKEADIFTTPPPTEAAVA